jgi:RNA polymerase sigma-70 factor, ECF subfamily
MDSARHDRFARAFVLSQGRVYGHIVTMLPNRHDAEDVFQQTSLVLWQKWDQFDPQQDFLSWACGVARNEVRNFLRRRGRDRVVLSDRLMTDLADVRLEVQPLLEERRTLLVECMKKLDFIARELLERCYLGSESMKAIARQFRTTPNALYLRLGRIRRELMECIEQGTQREDAP